MMHNIFLWFLMLVINFSCILFAYKQFGKIGLYIWVPISTILANVQVVMLVNLFGMESTLGNILYAGGFLATTLIMQCAIHFTPLEAGVELFDSVKNIFSLLPRLAVASLIAYLISQFHDVWLYEKIRDKFPAKKHIWLRNNGSTMVSQLLDNAVFTTIAFYGVYPIDIMINIFISTYIIKFIVALCDTPFIYIADKLFRDKKIPENI